MIRVVTLWVRRALLLFWGLIVLVLSAKITLDNPESAVLTLLGAEFTASSGVLFMVSLSIGILIGIAAVLPALYLAKRRYMRAEQRETVLKRQSPSQQS